MFDLSDIGAGAFVLRRRADGAFVYDEVNDALERITGLANDDFTGRTTADVFGPEVGREVMACQQRCAASRIQVEYETPFVGMRGTRAYQSTLTPLLAPNGQVERLLGITNDITDRRHLETELQSVNLRLRLALDALGGAHWFFDPATQTFELSSAFETLLGTSVPKKMSLAEWLGHVVEEDRNDTCFADLLAGRIGQGTAEFRVVAGNGETRWLRCRRQSATEGTSVTGIAGVVVDITREKRQEADLSRQATSDALTGLANRRRFDMELAVERAEPALAILMIDVDLFKAYNDHYGHIAGDAVLKSVAHLLDTIATNVGGIAARYGGEEFAIILPGFDLAGASAAAERITRDMESLALPHIRSPRRRVGASIGVAAGRALTPVDAAALVTDADRALYRAKAAGRGCYRIAAPEDLGSRAPTPAPRRRLPDVENTAPQRARSVHTSMA